MLCDPVDEESTTNGWGERVGTGTAGQRREGEGGGSQQPCTQQNNFTKRRHQKSHRQPFNKKRRLLSPLSTTNQPAEDEVDKKRIRVKPICRVGGASPRRPVSPSRSDAAYQLVSDVLEALDRLAVHLTLRRVLRGLKRRSSEHEGRQQQRGFGPE